eukprot:SAG31_NODE_3032_length_4764_cov_2.873526_1_plen_161_part_00
MSRPEHTAPPEIFYNDIEAKKYTQNSRMIQIQRTMTERAIELLALPEDSSLLLCDIGCGSGLSGEVLEEAGHGWVGCDISEAMLGVAVSRDNEGDGKRSYFLVFVQLFEKDGTLIERNAALIEKVSPCSFRAGHGDRTAVPARHSRRRHLDLRCAVALQR